MCAVPWVQKVEAHNWQEKKYTYIPRRRGCTIPVAWQGKDSELKCGACKACFKFLFKQTQGLKVRKGA